MLAPIFVERDKGVRALEQAYQSGGMLVMAAQKSAVVDEPEPDDISRVGTLAKVVQFSRLADGTIKALIEGRRTGEIDSFGHVRRSSACTTPLETKAPAKGRGCGR